MRRPHFDWLGFYERCRAFPKPEIAMRRSDAQIAMQNTRSETLSTA
jgi:hypothetical protein